MAAVIRGAAIQDMLLKPRTIACSSWSVMMPALVPISCTSTSSSLCELTMKSKLHPATALFNWVT